MKDPVTPEIERVAKQAISDNPGFFPNCKVVASLLRKHGIQVTGAHISQRLDMDSLQEQWIFQCSDQEFLENFRGGMFRKPALGYGIQKIISKRIKKIISDHIREMGNYPTPAGISEEMGIGKSSVGKYIDLKEYQKEFIRQSCDEKFFELVSGNRIVGASKDIREEVRQRMHQIAEEHLKENPEVFPSISSMVKSFSSTDTPFRAGTLSTHLDLDDLKQRWVAQSDERYFIENLVRSVFSKYRQDLVKARFSQIVNLRLEKYPGTYPSQTSIRNMLLEEGLHISINLVKRYVDLKEVQEKWLCSCTDEHFIGALGSGSIFGESHKKTIANRLIRIIGKTSKMNPEIFPSTANIRKMILAEYGKTIDPKTILKRTDVIDVQCKWINECSWQAFLDNYRSGQLSTLDFEVEYKKKERMAGRIISAVEDNPDLFPSNFEIAKMIGLDPKGKSWRIAKKYVDIKKIQAEWVMNSETGIFLENLSNGRLSNIGAIRKCVDERMRQILINNAENIFSLPISRTSLSRYVQKNPDLGLLIASYPGQSLDQGIVTRMNFWRYGRDRSLHDAIGMRLVQLWGFREMLLLAKDGRCMEADVISPLHESMHDALKEMVPASSISHFFVDQLMDGSYVTGFGREVLLLSFMSWMGPKQAAECLTRLNEAVEESNLITLTVGNRFEFVENIGHVLDTFGFTIEKTGTLCLFAPQEIEEPEKRKMTTVGSLLQMRKTGSCSADEARLFVKKNAIGERIRGEQQTVTYWEEDLDCALPLIVLREPAEVVDSRMRLREIDIENDSAVLDFGDGIVLGFNMDPKNPHTVELEGNRIPKGLNRAVMDIVRGAGKSLDVPDELSKKYGKFLEFIRKKKVETIRKRQIKSSGQPG